MNFISSLFTSYRAIVTGIVLAICFFMLGIFVSDNSGIIFQIDKAINQAAVAVQTPQLTKVMVWITDTGFGSELETLYIAALIALIILRKWPVAAGLALSVFLTHELTYSLKEFFERDRPDFKLIKAGGYSYPSGHTTQSSIVYIFLAYGIYKTLKPGALRTTLMSICFTITILIGISRVYLNVHWPTDIVGGILMTSAIFFIINGFTTIPEKKIS